MKKFQRLICAHTPSQKVRQAPDRSEAFCMYARRSAIISIADSNSPEYHLDSWQDQTFSWLSLASAAIPTGAVPCPSLRLSLPRSK
jgi:hypothetical protein